LNGVLFDWRSVDQRNRTEYMERDLKGKWMLG